MLEILSILHPVPWNSRNDAWDLQLLKFALSNDAFGKMLSTSRSENSHMFAGVYSQSARHLHILLWTAMLTT